jgi:hypothetical protein
MLIRRCAWHRLYNGYPIVYGVAGWRQRGLQYTDGMCRHCAATALQHWGIRREMALQPSRGIAGRLQTPAGRAGIAIAAASILVALGVTAMARRDGGRNVAVSALPRAATGAGPDTPREMCVDPAQQSRARGASSPRTR